MLFDKVVDEELQLGLESIADNSEAVGERLVDEGLVRRRKSIDERINYFRSSTKIEAGFVDKRLSMNKSSSMWARSRRNSINVNVKAGQHNKKQLCTSARPTD